MASSITSRYLSEAEWERAARGAEARRYPWGDSIDVTRANYFATRKGERVAGSPFPEGRTPEGVDHLAGNVWEWTRSAYRPYPYVVGDGRDRLDGDCECCVAARSPAVRTPCEQPSEKITPPLSATTSSVFGWCRLAFALDCRNLRYRNVCHKTGPVIPLTANPFTTVPARTFAASELAPSSSAAASWNGVSAHGQTATVRHWRVGSPSL